VGDAHVDIAKALKQIRKNLASAHRVDSALVEVKGKPTVHTRMQVVFNTKHLGVTERACHEILMTHALRAEKLGPGGFDRCLALVLDKLGAPGGSHLGLVMPQAHPASAVDVDRIVQVHTKRACPRTAAMLRRALDLAGFGGRIIVEKTHSPTASVELVRGYTFDLQQLLPIDASFLHARIFCIDGYVESVSEVHHLLEAASEAKEPCVLFVRGAADDVKHTLKVNYDRGSLRVLPIGVRFDLDGMNTLVDLSVVAGCDLISSLKGDLISSVKFHEAPYVDQVTVYRGRVIVTNSATHAAVASHVVNLRERRTDESVDDKGVLLDKRIKSLSPNHVVIRLPDDKDFVTSSQAIDYALRAVRSAIDYGVTDDGHLVSTELAARVHANRCVKTLLELGACLD
jgi:hypothetical protein